MARRRSFSIHSPFVSRCFASITPTVSRTARSRPAPAHPSGQAHPTGPRPVQASTERTRSRREMCCLPAARLQGGTPRIRYRSRTCCGSPSAFRSQQRNHRSCDRWPAIRKASSKLKRDLPTTCALSDAYVGRPRQATRWGTCPLDGNSLNRADATRRWPPDHMGSALGGGQDAFGSDQRGERVFRADASVTALAP